jgi:DNA modification methylase
MDSLNLNWTEKELPEHERTKHVHRLHPYLGKFIPQMVEIFLKKYFKEGQTILDPFCGSGTTLVQAAELGINSIGYDVSEFNVLLTKAKTQKYDIDRVSFEIFDILFKISSLEDFDSDQTRLMFNELPDVYTDNEYLKRWFSKGALRDILTYRYFIENSDYKYKDLLKIILSRSARSARLVKHFELDFPKEPQTESYWCFKHNKNCYPVESAYNFIKRYSIDTLNRLKEFSVLRKDVSVVVRHADVKRGRIPKVDGVLTSPPYVGLIDYHDQHVYAYNLFDLKDRSVDEIGSALCGSSKKAIEAYKNDITLVFKKIYSSLKTNGYIIVVINDKYNLFSDIAKETDLDIIDIIERKVNRRTGARKGEFSESVFILRK